MAPTFRRHTLLGEYTNPAMEPAISPSARRRPAWASRDAAAAPAVPAGDGGDAASDRHDERNIHSAAAPAEAMNALY